MATCYPPEEQYQRWLDRAEEFDMSVSGFMASMIEAGLKKFDTSTTPHETNQELREQRDDLKAELDHARERIEKLEDRLYRSDSEEIKRFVEDNPGADFELITDHLQSTVPQRTTEHLTIMEGDSITVQNGAYFPAEGD